MWCPRGCSRSPSTPRAHRAATRGFAGGQGAHLVANFAVTPGETLNVLVGGAGGSVAGNGGGGGGSFVYLTPSLTGLLIAAAGGGGIAGAGVGAGGSATNSATAGQGVSGGAAGTGGNGGGGGGGVAASTVVGAEDPLGFGGGGGSFSASVPSIARSGVQSGNGLVIITPILVTDACQVRYVENWNVGDSYINLTNSGASGASLTAGTTASVIGAICVNTYVFAADEQLMACCSSLVTPNGVGTLSVKNDLLNNVVEPQLTTTKRNGGTDGTSTGRGKLQWFGVCGHHGAGSRTDRMGDHAARQ